MPTIPKLVAAIFLSLLAYLVSKMVMEIKIAMEMLPESTSFGIFLPLNMVFGFLTGWFYVGRLATTRLADAVSFGLTGAVVMTFIALFAQSANEMTRLAMGRRYDGPMEAVAAIFQIGVNYGSEVLTMPVILTLVFGGIVTGVLTYLASRRWN